MGSWSGGGAQSHSQPSTHNAQPLEAERIPLLPYGALCRTASDDEAYPSSDRCAAHFVRGIFRHISFALKRQFHQTLCGLCEPLVTFALNFQRRSGFLTASVEGWCLFPLEAERIPLLPFSVYSVVNLNPQRSTHTIVNRKLINRKFYPLPTINYHLPTATWPRTLMH